MRRRGGGAGGFESGIRRSRVVIKGNRLSRVEALLETELVFDFLLGFLTADEFLGVGVVPTGEAELGWKTVAGGVREEL